MLLWISKHHKQNFTNLRFSLKSTWFSCWLPHKHQSIHYTHPPALTGSWLWPAKKIIVEINTSQKRNRISLKETWKSSRQTVHWILAACLLLSIFTYTDLVMSLWTYQNNKRFKQVYTVQTSQDFSWLQNGQVNWVSSASMFFFRASGFRFDFLRPILSFGAQIWNVSKILGIVVSHSQFKW